MNEAAKQIRAILQECLEEIDYWHGSGAERVGSVNYLSTKERSHPRGNGWARVYDKLTSAIAAFPADDGEPITEEWLRSIEDQLASVGITFHIYRNVLRDEWEPHHYAIEHRPDDGEGPMFIPCRMVKTRGDLRRLCAALGIPLKEQA